MLFIKTKRDMLLAPLQSVSGIVEKKHTLPILSNVLLEKKADIVTCVATDIEIQITTSTSGTSDDGDCSSGQSFDAKAAFGRLFFAQDGREANRQTAFVGPKPAIHQPVVRVIP